MFPGPWHHGPHGHGFGPGRGRKHRFFNRGGLKFVLLDLISETPRHGYDLIREIEERSGGYYSPSPGTVYPTLQLLEDQDLVKVTKDDGKKIYELTKDGTEYLEKHKEKIEEHRQKMADCCGPRGKKGHGGPGLMFEIKGLFFEIAQASYTVSGDEGKVKAIREVLEDTRKRIADITSDEKAG